MDDESKSEKPVDRTFSSKNLAPQQWDIADNPLEAQQSRRVTDLNALTFCFFLVPDFKKH